MRERGAALQQSELSLRQRAYDAERRLAAVRLQPAHYVGDIVARDMLVILAAVLLYWPLTARLRAMLDHTHFPGMSPFWDALVAMPPMSDDEARVDYIVRYICDRWPATCESHVLQVIVDMVLQHGLCRDSGPANRWAGERAAIKRLVLAHRAVALMDEIQARYARKIEGLLHG